MQMRAKRKKEARDNLIKEEILQDDRFFFIAGYTSGGVPYGVTWKEMSLKPWEDLAENECVASAILFISCDRKVRKNGRMQKNSPGSSESENVV